MLYPVLREWLPDVTGTRATQRKLELFFSANAAARPSWPPPPERLLLEHPVATAAEVAEGTTQRRLQLCLIRVEHGPRLC